MKTTKVESNNIDEISLLLSRKKKLLKEEIYFDPSEKIHSSVLKKNNCIYGTWDVNGVLIGISNFYMWHSAPYYTISDLYICQSVPVSNYAKFINSNIGFGISEMETKKRYQFYFMTLLRPFQKKMLKEGSIWKIRDKYHAFKNYNLNLETVIFANTQPEYELYWNIMGKKTWNSDIWIRRGTMKENILTKNIMQDNQK